jgi:hypothetical protein
MIGNLIEIHILYQVTQIMNKREYVLEYPKSDEDEVIEKEL